MSLSIVEKRVIAERIVQTLWKNGFEAYFAGGSVRDLLLGKEPTDFDIASSATPEDIQKLFPKTVPVGAAFGVMLVVEEGASFEVARFRKEGVYLDGRHPTEVSFASVEEDARRRDFTINGLYFDVRTKKILDFVGGETDLKKGCIRAIGNADERFLEDHLRIMRAIRFAVQLGFEIEAETFASVKRHASKIQKIANERIREEFAKILTSANPRRGLELLDETGILKYVMPELESLKGVEQPMEYHPEGDVWIHTLMLMEGLKHAPIELAMGALLHDIAKPETFVRAVDRIRFHGHDKIGAEKSEGICKRLTFSNDETKLICSLVAEHLRFKDAMQMRVATLKRFLRLERFDLHLELHRLDCMASHGKLEAYHFCKAKYEEFLKEPPPPSKIVTGEDLIALGFSPGPEFSKILRTVEDAVLEEKVKTREEGLKFVKDHFVK